MSSTQEKLEEIRSKYFHEVISYYKIAPEGTRLPRKQLRQINKEFDKAATALIDSAKREGAIEANAKWKQYLFDNHEHHEETCDLSGSPYVDSLEMEACIDRDTTKLEQSEESI